MKTRTKVVIAIAGLSVAGATGAAAITNHVAGDMSRSFKALEFTEVHQAGGRWGERGRRGGRGMSAVLREADTNNDRAITQDEVDVFIADRVSQSDANGDGDLTLEEFAVVWNDLSRRQRVRAFQRLDENGDAVISAEELDDRFGSIVERLDRNDDGVLNREDRRGRHRRDR